MLRSCCIRPQCLLYHPPCFDRRPLHRFPIFSKLMVGSNRIFTSRASKRIGHEEKMHVLLQCQCHKNSACKGTTTHPAVCQLPRSAPQEAVLGCHDRSSMKHAGYMHRMARSILYERTPYHIHDCYLCHHYWRPVAAPGSWDKGVWQRLNPLAPFRAGLSHGLAWTKISRYSQHPHARRASHSRSPSKMVPYCGDETVFLGYFKVGVKEAWTEPSVLLRWARATVGNQMLQEHVNKRVLTGESEHLHWRIPVAQHK